MKPFIKNSLIALFQNWSGTSVKSITPLPPSGSARVYYRLTGEHHQAIGVFHPDDKETKAFIGFTRHFLEKGLPVPEIYATDPDNKTYLIQDLGDHRLFDRVRQLKNTPGREQEIYPLYQRVLENLAAFQIIGGQQLDYTLCYPRKSFDVQSIHWDLNYFKYHFLKLAYIPFDEAGLEKDFTTLADYLNTADQSYFMYRDFQSRNIMLTDNQLYFIDYQGGRQGALQYDPASLLFEGKTNLPFQMREQLLGEYINILQSYFSVDAQTFKHYYYLFVLIRLLQAFGAYGYRGLYEKKALFKASIPYGLKNIEWLLTNTQWPIDLPILTETLYTMTQSSLLKNIGQQSERLTLHIQSFSYRRGIPDDFTGHGGGYVFDCRALPNPGLYEQYKASTGQDEDVIAFMDKQKPVRTFVKQVENLVRQSIQAYQEKGYTDLTINFGCTGGQHRSVYIAETIAQYVQTQYDLPIDLNHREIEA